MQNDKEKMDSLKNTLKFISRCPVCSASYKTDTAKLFARNDLYYFVHITCKSCESHFMAMVTFVGKGVSTVGMITDLSYADAERLFTENPITLDEILDNHKIIKGADLHNILVKNF